MLIVYVYVYVFSTCTDSVEKRIRSPQVLSFVLYLYFCILEFFYFCIVELRVLADLKYRKKKKERKKNGTHKAHIEQD